jgi:hypothetical protein
MPLEGMPPKLLRFDARLSGKFRRWRAWMTGTQQRKLWLDTAAGIFKMIYDDPLT